eukprot:7473733-Lingulodinium_polyedra.AAC.1
MSSIEIFIPNQRRAAAASATSPRATRVSGPGLRPARGACRARHWVGAPPPPRTPSRTGPS